MIKKNIFLFLGTFFLFFIFTVFFLNKNTLLSNLNKYNLLPKPEPLTELYFEDHTKLPKAIVSEKEYQFGFVVHNLEYKDFIYDYSVIAEASKSATILAKGSFSLKHDEYKTVSEKFSISDEDLKTKIIVNLDNKKQGIHFWVNSPKIN